MKPEVIIIGQNSSIILGQMRALGEDGYIVHVLKTCDVKPKRKPYELYSNYLHSYGYISKSNEVAFINTLLNEYADEGIKKIIIPCDDNVASNLDKHCEELCPYFLFPNINYQNGRVSYFMDKAIQKELAICSKLNTPKGWYIEWKGNNYIIPVDIEYPCFVKPAVYHVRRKFLMKRCCNKQELEDVMSVCPIGLPMLVEQYIDITQEYGVSGISVNGKVMITSLIKKVDTYLGTTASGTISPMILFPEIHAKLTNFVESMTYTGIFDIDLYESHGKMYFCECNLRLGNSGVATLINGINLPVMLVNALCGEDVDFNAPYFMPRFFIDERVYIQKYWSGEITWPMYKSTISKADIRYIYNEKDVKPYKFFMADTNLTKIYRFIKGLLTRTPIHR